MKSKYKRLGPFIRQVDVRNVEDKKENLLGVSTKKVFIESIANTVGTNFKRYKVVKKGQFTYVPDTSRRGDKIGLALLETHDEALVSNVYTVFEVIDHEELLPEYLMMWFRRPEFDRYARYMSHGSVRELFGWEEMCDVMLPIPDIGKQREIVKEYRTIVDRITLNEKLNQKLEETAQAIYKQWFVDFEFPLSSEQAAAIGKPELAGKPYKSSCGEMVYNDELERDIPVGWCVDQLSNRCSKIGSGSTPRGGKVAYKQSGVSLIRSLNVHDYNFQFRDLAFIDDAQAKKLKNVEVQEKDILLNITGVSVARCCRVSSTVLPARVNQHVAIVRVKPAELSSCYLLFALCSTDYKQRLLGSSEAGSTRQAITKGEIEEFEMLIPDAVSLEAFEELADSLVSYKEKLFCQTERLLDTQNLLLSKMTKAGA